MNVEVTGIPIEVNVGKLIRKIDTALAECGVDLVDCGVSFTQDTGYDDTR